jgi:hypothetical protein
MNLIDHEQNIQEAIDLPRISQTSANGSPTWEAGFSQAVIDELQANPPYGHNLSDGRLSVIGSVQGVVISSPGKIQYGAADRRRVGAVVTVKLSEIDNCRHCRPSLSIRPKCKLNGLGSGFHRRPVKRQRFALLLPCLDGLLPEPLQMAFPSLIPSNSKILSSQSCSTNWMNAGLSA